MANSSKGAKKKTAAPKTKKTSSRTKETPQNEPVRPLRREIGGIFSVFLAAIVIVSFFDKGGFFRVVTLALKGLLGKWGYFVAPVCLVLAGFILLLHRGRPVKFRVFSALILPVLLSNMINLWEYHPAKGLGFPDMLIDLWEQGIAGTSGGVIGGLPAQLMQMWLHQALPFLIFLILFVFFLIKAVNFSVSEAYDRVKERVNIPYDPADYEENEPVVNEKIVRERRTGRPQRVSEPAIATSPAPKRHTYSPDIPIGEEGEALTVGQLDDIPDQSFSGKGTSRARVRRKSTSEVIPEPAETEESIRTDKLSGRDIGDGWKEYKAGRKGAEPVKVRPTVPVAAEISDPPKAEKIKKEDVEKETELFAQAIKADTDAADEYVFPPLDLLNMGSSATGDARDEIALNRDRLENAIRSFGINASVVGVVRGPTVTRYDFELEQGVKLARVTNLAGDLALALGVINVRIAPIPEKISTVGIEVPNKIVSTVYLRSILESSRFQTAKSRLSFAVGKDIGGECIVGNIAKLPHMLIAGTTGSGKSVCMNSLILSLLYKARPDEVKFIMIDPKMVELGIYSGIPHMLTPVVTEPKKAAGALQWAVVEMLKRYRLFSEAGVREIEGYNKHCELTGEPKLAQVVVVIDELADLMMIAAKEVEESICRVAQMGRAAGMHLIVATQRPSADVITGLMKANIPSRIAFAVSSAMESRIIMDQSGAEKLIGMGDMLYSPLGSGKPTRVQGAFVSDEERERVIDFIKENNPTAKPENNQEIGEYMTRAEQSKDGGKDKDKEAEASPAAGEYDEMLPQAVEAILETKQCSVSMLQRRVKLGYSRAARIVDQMEELGIVGPYEGAKPRSVLVDREGWHEIQVQLGLASDSDLALAAEMNEENEE